MTTMPINKHPLTQRRLQFKGIGVKKLTLKSINIVQVCNFLIFHLILFGFVADCVIYKGFVCNIDVPFKETRSVTMNILRKKNIFFLNHLLK